MVHSGSNCLGLTVKYVNDLFRGVVHNVRIGGD